MHHTASSRREDSFVDIVTIFIDKPQRGGDLNELKIKHDPCSEENQNPSWSSINS